MREPERQRSGYRSYGDDSVRLVRFIKRAQELGFTLAEIEELLRLASGGPESCREVRTLATAKVDDIERRIAALQSMRTSLLTLVKTCGRGGRRRRCPLIETIEESA